MIALRVILISLVSLVCLPVTGDERTIQDENWPATLDEAVAVIVGGLSAENRELVRQTEYEDLIQYHHGWGTDIRNKFGLWRGNEALMLSACGRQCHPDTASMRIIEAVWLELQK